MRTGALRRRLGTAGLHGALALRLALSIVPPVMHLAASLNETALCRSPTDPLLLKD